MADAKVFLVHGWDGSPANNWFPWLKRELEQRGFLVSAPAMPHPRMPTIEDWVSHLSATVGKPDENTYLIGHSMGCQAIARYLERLPGLSALPAANTCGQRQMVCLPAGSFLHIFHISLLD